MQYQCCVVIHKTWDTPILFSFIPEDIKKCDSVKTAFYSFLFWQMKMFRGIAMCAIPGRWFSWKRTPTNFWKGVQQLLLNQCHALHGKVIFILPQTSETKRVPPRAITHRVRKLKPRASQGKDYNQNGEDTSKKIMRRNESNAAAFVQTSKAKNQMKFKTVSAVQKSGWKWNWPAPQGLALATGRTLIRIANVVSLWCIWLI